MKKSLFNTYYKEYSNRISKNLESIDKISDELKNIKFKNIINYSHEIMKYFQYSNGSAGNDIFVIRYLLHELLFYIYLVQEKNITEEEQNTCQIEIETRFYFLLNCIYNIKEKFEKFFDIKICKKKDIDFKTSILNEPAKNIILELFKNSYKAIKDYCEARRYIVHGIYDIEYNISKNEIYVSCSTFDFSENHNNEEETKVFNLEDKKLISLVEGIQQMLKNTLEIISDTKNIDLGKLRIKKKIVS